MGRTTHLCEQERSRRAVLSHSPLPVPGYRGRAVVKRLLLASPRGYCAGGERAVETVERALAHYGSPVYVRKQIVHNSHVVEDLRSRGAVFVDQLADVPGGATVVFSPHGLPPAGRAQPSSSPPRPPPRPCAEKPRDCACPRSTRPARSSRRCMRRPAAT